MCYPWEHKEATACLIECPFNANIIKFMIRWISFYVAGLKKILGFDTTHINISICPRNFN